MSLYRLYRPQVFSDVVGQEHVVTTLEQAVKQGKVAHAYLFAGPRGTGKTSVARILAKAMLSAGVTDAVLEKQIARGVEEGSIIDLVEIDAASNRGIDDIRSLVEKIQFSPVVTSAKVYIIDEVHMLTREAFNALLKTLEEPPAYAFFILATTELHRIPPTIQSRCQCFVFRQVRDEDLVRRLQFIADQERISVDRAALRAIAHAARGGMRDAISLLDQLRSLPKIALEDVEQRIGASGREYVEPLFAAMQAGDIASVMREVRAAEEAGIAIDALARELLSELRLHLHEALEAKQPVGDILVTLDSLLQAVRDIRVSPLPALALEAALLSLCTGKGAKKQASPAAPPSPVPAPGKAAPAPPLPPASMTSALVEIPPPDLEGVLHAWPGIVEKVKPASVKMSLKNGRVVAVGTETITVQFSARFHRDRVLEQAARHHLEDVLASTFKRMLRLEGVLEGERGAQAPPPGPAVDLAEAAAEVF